MLRRKRAKDDGMCVRRLRRNLLSTFHLPLRAYAATQYYSVLHLTFYTICRSISKRQETRQELEKEKVDLDYIASSK